MSNLYVRTHWTDEPPTGQPQLQPAPVWASAYPGSVPTQPFVLVGTTAVPPKWTPPSGPVPPSEAYTVWFPVVRDSDLVNSGWASGPGWAGSPPPQWESASGAPANTNDQGYGPGATGFRVDRVRLYIQGQTTGGANFTFTVVAPNGTVVGTLTSASGWTTWLSVPAAIADGKGFWSVIINRAAGVAVQAPTLYPTAGSPGNAVNEPYVSPYNNAFEGILGVQVDGTEITVVQPSAPSFTATVGGCDANNKRDVDLRVDFTPPLPAGWGYRVDWTTGLPPPPPPSANGTVGATPLPSVTAAAPVSYPPGTYYPSVVVTLTPPGGVPTTTPLYHPGLVVPTCPTVVDCPDVRITASRTGLCVDANGTTGPVTFTAQVLSGMPPTPVPWPGSFTWTVRDQSGALVPLPTPTPQGDTLTLAFTAPDRYTVTATIVRAQGCDPVILVGTTPVDVARCGCPAIVGGVLAQRVNGCSFDFSASVVASGATGLTYSWDFGDGTTSSNPPPLRHNYAPGSGPRVVTLTVTDDRGCTATASTTVTLDCGGNGECAEFGSAILATPTATDPCTFDLSVSVTGGTAASQVTWSLPGGGTATGTTARTTIPAGTTQTVTANLSTPGCDARTVSTTLTCGGSPPVLPGCAILLVIAMLLMAIGTVVGIVGACASNIYVLIAGAAILAVGLILFIIWALLCAGRTACSLMRVVHCVLFTLVAVVLPALSIVLAILAIIGVVGIPCMISAIVSWGYWGAMYAWLGFIMRRVGCTPTC